MENPNTKQIGGDHYSHRVIQPWDMMHRYSLNFFEANTFKYISRWRLKGGPQDLEKARHYVEKLYYIETHRGFIGRMVRKITKPIIRFFRKLVNDNTFLIYNSYNLKNYGVSIGLRSEEIAILERVLFWKDPNDLLNLNYAIDSLAAKTAKG